jgi:hypothetical protein
MATSKAEKQIQDSALRAYLAACDSAREQARGDGIVAGGIPQEEGHRRAKHAWAALQRARIFVVEPSTYARFYRKADLYTTEVLAGLKWFGPKEPLRIGDPVAFEEAREQLKKQLLEEHKDETDPEHLMVACSEAGRHIAFPGRLPFDAVFLAYGNVGISIDHIGARAGTKGTQFLLRLGFERFTINGHLLWWEGDRAIAYAFVSGMRVDDPGNWHCMLLRAYEDGEWDHPYDLDPWVVPSIIHAINEHRSLTATAWTMGQRLTRKMAPNAGTLPLPKPYYVVRLEDEAVNRAFDLHTQSTKPPREFSHRFDVRAHECTRVLRGALPMDPEVQDRLAARGYRIYADKEPLSEDHERLTARKMSPKKPDEWMAILTYWRDSYVKGPDHLPYIPAMRTGV